MGAAVTSHTVKGRLQTSYSQVGTNVEVQARCDIYTDRNTDSNNCRMEQERQARMLYAQQASLGSMCDMQVIVALNCKAIFCHLYRSGFAPGRAGCYQ